MTPHFIEVTISSDSNDPLAAPRKGIIRHDQITSIVDISSGEYVNHTLTQITLVEEYDYQNDADDIGGVIRGRRTLCVQEDYETVKTRLVNACQAAC
ncbi:hypothetical protein ACFFU8_09360 [Chromobacterium piscinae]|uniref:hypothetical protein n=1 Tax=Chromobacterium piscinae TaxID=686831 RepID=UPI001E2C48F2|nr:hypothetical protein [Chromobacterium piscinae]MCD5327888.1 hypothetical protein [Chromobacterium piscinae]